MDLAREIEASAGRVQDSADRRMTLAANRAVLAAERTCAARARTVLIAPGDRAPASAPDDLRPRRR